MTYNLFSSYFYKLYNIAYENIGILYDKHLYYKHLINLFIQTDS